MARAAPEDIPTKEVLYRSGVRLFAERGYHGTSVREVAADAGIHMSSMYHHFPDKQGLLREIFARTVRDLAEAVHAAMAAATDPGERLAAALRTHIMFHGRRREECFIADSELRALSPDNRAEAERALDDYEQIFIECVEAGVREGIFATDNVKLAVYALASMSTGVSVWYRADGPLSLETIAANYVHLMFRGLLVTAS
jgi:AcrR family transcriptional regulator